LAEVGSELKAAHTHTHTHTICFHCVGADLLYFWCCQCTSLLCVSIFTLLFILSTFLSLLQNGARNIPLCHFPLNRSCIICFLL